MLGLIADDLTGAGDASVQFAKRGWDVFLTLDSAAPGFPGAFNAADSSLIAVTTDCRALSNDAAEALTSAALTALTRAGADRVFLKIDSTMRGSVRGQIAGALAAWRTRHRAARAIVCPAYPRMGRTIEFNQLLVHGERVERTAIGRDPVTPVRTSDMAALLPASPDVHVVDAVTDADLMKLAESIEQVGPSVIPVGSAGLAAAVAAALSVHSAERETERGTLRRRSGRTAPEENSRPPVESETAMISPKRRILLQVSSLNPVSHAQVARLKAAFPEVVVLLPPAERGDSAAVAANLARAFAAHAAREAWDVFGLVGGDGAREALAHLGASGIRIIDSLAEGIPLGLVVGGNADGTPVFTKAGGFGDEDALVRCVERMNV